MRNEDFGDANRWGAAGHSRRIPLIHWLQNFRALNADLASCVMLRCQWWLGDSIALKLQVVSPMPALHSLTQIGCNGDYWNS